MSQTDRETYLRRLAESERYDLQSLGAAWTAMSASGERLRWIGTSHILTTEEAILALEQIRDFRARIASSAARTEARMDEQYAWLR